MVPGEIDAPDHSRKLLEWWSRQRYPPATNVLLWPFVGWLDFEPAHWFWAVTSVAAIGWLIRLLERACAPGPGLERAFVLLLSLSMNATGVAIGNGQLTLHVLPALVAAVALLHRARGRWPAELGAAALIVFAFVKPSLAIPFFWLVIFVPGTLRPAMLVLTGYGALTLLAAAFQPTGVVALLRDWVAAGVEISASRHTLPWSYASLHSWTASWGLQRWNFVSSLVMLAGLGVWTFLQRRRDIWILLGVTGVVARLWTYHGTYDDVLILLPMVALFRIATHGAPASRDGVAAGVLLAITTLTMVMPVRLSHWPAPWWGFFTIGHAAVWIAVLIFLVNHARRLAPQP